MKMDRRQPHPLTKSNQRLVKQVVFGITVVVSLFAEPKHLLIEK